jgi:glycosyltransferase involved in cell wall biosynthesis
MGSPAISILVPVYNGRPYFKECIDSVLAQDFQDWELFISDNGSNDGTREYLDTLTDPRIRIVQQEKNLGIWGNLNFLFQEASAPISQILCADDFMVPGGLSKIMQCWAETPAEVVSLRFNWSLLSQSFRYKIAHDILPLECSPKNSDLRYFIFGCLQGSLSNVGIRTAIINERGGFRQDLPFAGDFDFWSKMSRDHPWKAVEDIVIKIRPHEGQASSYLNRNGEGVNQQLLVRQECFMGVSGKCSNLLLRTKGSWDYFRFIHQGFRTLVFEKRTAPLWEVFRQARQPMHLPRICAYILYLVTMNGRIGANYITQILIRSWNSRNPSATIG